MGSRGSGSNKSGGAAGKSKRATPYENEVTDMKAKKNHYGEYNLVSDEVFRASEEALSELKDGEELVITRSMTKGITQTISVTKNGDTITMQGEGFPELKLDSYSDSYPVTGTGKNSVFQMEKVSIISPNKFTAQASTFTPLDLGRLISGQDRPKIKKISFKIS